MEPILIQIDWIYFLGIVGFLILLAWKAGSRFTAIETSITWIKDIFVKLEGRIGGLENRMGGVESRMGGVEGRIGGLEGRFDKSFAMQSPISLLQRGKDIIEDSGLKKYIDDNKDILLEQCKSKKILSNPYDIQESSFKFFDEIEFSESLEETMKTTAFNFGTTLGIIRRIGGIYFRDICLGKLGFKPEDLDTSKDGENEDFSTKP